MENYYAKHPTTLESLMADFYTGEIVFVSPDFYRDKVDVSIRAGFYMVEPEYCICERGIFSEETRAKYSDPYLLITRTAGGDSCNTLAEKGKAQGLSKRDAEKLAQDMALILNLVEDRCFYITSPAYMEKMNRLYPNINIVE